MSSKAIRTVFFVLAGLLLIYFIFNILNPTTQRTESKLREVSHRLDSVSYHLQQAKQRIDSLLQENTRAQNQLRKLNREVDSLNQEFMLTKRSSTLKINKLKQSLKQEQNKLQSIQQELNKL